MLPERGLAREWRPGGTGKLRNKGLGRGTKHTSVAPHSPSRPNRQEKRPREQTSGQNQRDEKENVVNIKGDADKTEGGERKHSRCVHGFFGEGQLFLQRAKTAGSRVVGSLRTAGEEGESVSAPDGVPGSIDSEQAAAQNTRGRAERNGRQNYHCGCRIYDAFLDGTSSPRAMY